MERAMIEGQLNIFDVLYPKFKIDKPIRLIELFDYYESQCIMLDLIDILKGSDKE